MRPLKNFGRIIIFDKNEAIHDFLAENLDDLYCTFFLFFYT